MLRIIALGMRGNIAPRRMRTNCECAHFLKNRVRPTMGAAQ